VSKKINIKSHKGMYEVNFLVGALKKLNQKPIENAIYIIDKNISILYQNELKNILSHERVLIINATEENKSLDKFSIYINELVKLNIRRQQPLIAIGGGIIQDITCFLATTVMRGLPWIFFPTTLLAQSDSCIGSKSSINSGDIKNILGTFTPPEKIIIDVDLLKTLKEVEILSGMGEMLKVHAINSPESFNLIAQKYNEVIHNPLIMEEFIYSSLSMKKVLIEIDEFDIGPRNVMNYGHSFGHAIESSTNFSIPHGIAVTIGMDIANFVAAAIGVSTMNNFKRMHTVLDENCKTFRHINIDVDLLLKALSKDKKNSLTKLRLILPGLDGSIFIGLYDNNKNLRNTLYRYFEIYGQIS